MSQAANAAAAILRIPILIAALGAADYGVTVLVLSAMPWILVLGQGLRVVTRSHLAEVLEAGEDSTAATVRSAALASARRLRLLVSAGLVVPAAVLPLLLLGSEPVTTRATAAATVVVVLLLSTSTFTGMVRLGALEASGQFGTSNALGALSGVLGLVLVAGLAVMGGGVWAMVLVSATAVASPFLAADVIGRRLMRGVDGGRTPALSNRVVGAHVLQQCGPLLMAGLAPAIVAAALGPVAVAAYSIVARLAIAVTFVPTALMPLLGAASARARAAGGPSRLGRPVLIVLLAGGLVASGAFVVLAPAAAHLISGGSVDVSRSLVAWFAAWGALQVVMAPVVAQLSGRSHVTFLSASYFAVGALTAALSIPAVQWFGVDGAIALPVLAATVLVIVWAVRLHTSRGMAQELYRA